MSAPVRIVFLGGLGEIGRNCFCLEVDDRILVVDCGISFPIYGSPLSLGLARNRIEEAGMLGRTEMIPVHDGERRMIGPFDCEFIPVTHSVPHAFATAYHTPAGTILHSGDFKLDPTPVDGRTTDLSLMGAIAKRSGGVKLLMSDSTNACRPGFTP